MIIPSAPQDTSARCAQGGRRPLAERHLVAPYGIGSASSIHDRRVCLPAGYAP
jgi:hypothetical protein